MTVELSSLHQSKRLNFGEVPKEYQATVVIALLLWHDCRPTLWVLEWQQASAVSKLWRLLNMIKIPSFITIKSPLNQHLSWSTPLVTHQMSSALCSLCSQYTVCHVQLRVTSCRLCGTFFFAGSRWCHKRATVNEIWLVVSIPLKILVNWDDYSEYMGK